MIMQEEKEITKALENYESKGQKAAKEIQVKTIKDLNKKKEITQGQFFTPAPVAAFLTKILGLDEYNETYRGRKIAVMDNSCGIGKLLRYVHKDYIVSGIDIDNNAIQYARKTFYERENWQFSTGNVATAEFSDFDVALLNPPFNILIQTDERIKLQGAMWGKNGPDTCIWSHIAAISSAVKAGATIIAMILPENAFKNERDWNIDKILKDYKQVYYAKLNKTFFQKEGANVSPIITIFVKKEGLEALDLSNKDSDLLYTYWYNPSDSYDGEKEIEPFTKLFFHKNTTCDEVNSTAPVLIKNETDIKEEIKRTEKIKSCLWEVLKQLPPFHNKPEVSILYRYRKIHAAKSYPIPLYASSPKLTLNIKNSSEIAFVPDSVYSALIFEAAKRRTPTIGYSGKDPEEKGNKQTWRRFNFVNIAKRIAILTRSQTVQNIFNNFMDQLSYFLKTEKSPELQKLIEKREKQYQREDKYFEKWTFKSEMPNARLLNGEEITLNVIISFDFEEDNKDSTKRISLITIKDEETQENLNETTRIWSYDRTKYSLSFTLPEFKVPITYKIKKLKIRDDGTVNYAFKVKKNKQLHLFAEKLKENGLSNEDVEKIVKENMTLYGINSSQIQQILDKKYSQEKKWTYDNENSIVKAYPKLYDHIKKEVEKTEIPLWNFQKKDIIRTLMKPNAIIGDVMGLGKTRMLLAIAAVMKQRGAKKVLIITEEKLTSGYLKEAEKIDYPYKLVKIKQAKDIPRDLTNTVLLTSYTKIWRDTKDTNKPLWKHLRKVNTLLIDELQNLKSPTTRQTAAIRKIHARRKILASGTPIKNYPYNFFSPMAIAFGENTHINPFSYKGFLFVEENGSLQVTAARQHFINKFVIVAEYSERFKQTLDAGKKRRRFPGIKDIELWNELTRKMIIRRIKEEPEVAEEIKFPSPTIKKIVVTPGEYHKEYYNEFVQKFKEWMLSHMQIEISEGRAMRTLEILMQLIVLQFVSTIPQAFKEDSDLPYKGPELTEKQKKVIEIVENHYKKNEKIIVFSEKPAFCEYMAEKTKNKFKNVVFTGRIPNSKRETILEQFKKQKGAMVMWATTKTGGTGLNIPQANIVVIADRSWVPGDHIQAYSRILRPEQNKEPIVYFVENEAFIDQYMKQLEMYKISAINEGIDGQIDRADISKYISYKDFAMSMLQDMNILSLNELSQYVEAV